MNHRFKRILREGDIRGHNEIWIDTETGVNYLFHTAGNTSGLTPLLDKDGHVVVTQKDEQ